MAAILKFSKLVDALELTVINPAAGNGIDKYIVAEGIKNRIGGNILVIQHLPGISGEVVFQVGRSFDIYAVLFDDIAIGGKIVVQLLGAGGIKISLDRTAKAEIAAQSID